MPSLLARLADKLAPWAAAPAWRVAFSGGLDSTVLLHALTCLRREQRIPPLSAIHVHHGLQALADDWVLHCQAVCQSWQVPLSVARVRVTPGDSLEAAARQARYGALAEGLLPGTLMLLAHHADDQVETLLFRLLRGAGVRGLAGMPEQRYFAGGTLLRPLLDCSRQELLRYAEAQGLTWIEDPSNSSHAFARNTIRHELLPKLETYWPQARRSIARAARHLRESQGLLEEVASGDLAQAQSPVDWPWLDLPSLALAPLAALSPARQRNALRLWLAVFSQLPDEAHWDGWTTLRDAAPDATPLWRLAGGLVQRSQGRLWWLSGDWLKQPVTQRLAWPDPSVPLRLAGNGQLSLKANAALGPLQVCYRQGGEQLILPGRGHRDLKRLLNESALPLFVRGRLPLIYREGRLIAVANLPQLSSAEALGWDFTWSPPTTALD